MTIILLAALCVGVLYLLRRRRSNQTGGSWLAVAVLALFGVLVVPALAAAAVTPADPAATAESLLGLDAFTVTVLMGLILPVINGLIMRPNWSSRLKAALGVITAGVAAVVNVSLTDGGGALISQSTLKTAALTWAIQIVTLYGVYKPVGVDGRLKAVGT